MRLAQQFTRGQEVVLPKKRHWQKSTVCWFRQWLSVPTILMNIQSLQSNFQVENRQLIRVAQIFIAPVLKLKIAQSQFFD